jgi:transcriptional regulator of acetoin/glycerol metabolism
VPAALLTVSHSSNGIVPMAELERQTILDALTKVNGDKMLAARLLGIGKTTLYRKLKEYEQVHL